LDFTAVIIMAAKSYVKTAGRWPIIATSDWSIASSEKARQPVKNALYTAINPICGREFGK